jgi:hypothetical protein
MKPAAGVFKTGKAGAWTRERLDQLGKQEMLNLQANAIRLGEPELAALCGELLKARPRRGPGSNGAAARTEGGRQRLLPRRSIVLRAASANPRLAMADGQKIVFSSARTAGARTTTPAGYRQPPLA